MLSKRHAKIIISLLLLVLVARSLDGAQLLRVMSSIPGWTVLILCAGYFLGQILSSLKWWLLARSCALEVSFPETFRIYFTAMFVNLAGIGTLGGDVLRGALIGSAQAKPAVGFATVVADRAHGLAVLAAIGTACVGLFSSDLLPPHFGSALFAISIAIMASWLIAPKAIIHFVPNGSPFRPKAVEVARAFPTEPRAIAIITGISIIFHLLQISLHLCIAKGLGIEVSLTTLLTIVPFVNILSSLPISWQGLGVRENAYRFFFVPAICSAEQSVAFGALWLLAITISALIGGLIGLASGAFEKRNCTVGE
jgi:uncharacterized membrane protein YbhN (UPF0104 family)